MRIRLRFSKLGKIRFTSQRDVARMWERALRRAGLPLAYSEGFSPRPQLSFGLALPTGCESLAEYLDVELDDLRPETAGVDLPGLPAVLTGLLPDGIEVERAVRVDPRAGSLQQLVSSCSWTIGVSGVSRSELATLVASLLAAPSVLIERERKGRQVHDDLRPSVLGLAVADPEPVADGDGNGVMNGVFEGVMVADLATQPRGVRPVELIRGLIAVAGGSGDSASTGPDSGGPPVGTPVLGRACRTQQWIERDGRREEPLDCGGTPVDAGRATHALERAS